MEQVRFNYDVYEDLKTSQVSKIFHDDNFSLNFRSFPFLSFVFVVALHFVCLRFKISLFDNSLICTLKYTLYSFH